MLNRTLPFTIIILPKTFIDISSVRTSNMSVSILSGIKSRTHDPMNLIPHSTHELERGQPRNTPQNNQQIRLNLSTLGLSSNRRRTNLQPRQSPRIQNDRYECSITKHPHQHHIRPKCLPVPFINILRFSNLRFFNSFGGEFLQRRLVELIKVGVVEAGLLVRFALCVYRCCFKGRRFIVTFCAPGYIVRVAEGVDVDDVCVGWGEEEVLQGL